MNSLLLNVICAFAIANTSPNAERAQQTLDALYKNYAAPNTCLLRENYPSDQNNKATYLASEEQAKRHNEYSYLWPYSGTFSAVNALLESTGNKKYKKLLENKVLPGLEEYFDTRREPFAYSSYISNQPLSDRFYDDNVWLGIDFTDSYRMTKKQAYLEKAELIWEFILSGKDEVLGGGIYWCEQKKESKNTCSNAPGAVFALKLFQATQDSTYLKQGKELYEWTKKNLEDPTDHLYFDNIALNKKIGLVKAYSEEDKDLINPPQIVSTGNQSNTTGYHIRMGIDTTFVSGQGETATPMIRYAEALLAYAEAAEELGKCDAAVLEKTIKPLRERAGVTYLAPSAIDPNFPDFGYTISANLQEIRRERRSELPLQGMRLDDLMRWRAHKLFQGKRGGGAYFGAGSVLYKSIDLKNEELAQILVDNNDYLDPLKNVLPRGFQFDAGRDYLLPIPPSEISLNKELTQNPGWRKN